MTIKGLFKYIKDHAPQAVKNVEIDQLKGKRVAVDGNNFMYTAMAVARKEIVMATDLMNNDPDVQAIRKKWFSSFCYFIQKWLKNGITPVIVFDSNDNVPKEKDGTREERRLEKEKRLQTINQLKDELRNGDCLISSTQVLKNLQRALSNYNMIESNDYENFRYCAVYTGVPIIIANGDGEKLCSMLAREGKVAAVFSADSDNLAYGCPYLIRKFENGMLQMVILEEVLKSTKLSFSQFQDLAIISGCDYNENLKGYAFMKCLKFFQKYGYIENIPLDFSPTNYIRCRELFKIESSYDCVEKQLHPAKIFEEYEKSENFESNDFNDFESNDFKDVKSLNLNINKSALFLGRDEMERFECGHFVTPLLSLFESLPEPNEDKWRPSFWDDNMFTKKVTLLPIPTLKVKVV